jgi:hypothetical protein
VAVVAVAAVVGVTAFGGTSKAAPWPQRSTPLGHATVALPTSCRDLPAVGEDDKVTSAAIGCAVDDGVEVAVVEFDFGGAQLDAVEPQFLVSTILASHDGGWTRPVVDTFDTSPTSTPVGQEYGFTGRAVLHGVPVHTVGALVVNGNRGMVVVGGAPDRDTVAPSVERMRRSLEPAAPPA